MFGAEVEYSVNDRNLLWVEPVIVQWLKIQRDYLEESECADALYSYNERASISSLAGAVWRCGGFALEEFSAKKGDEKNKSSGRIDLYFSFSGHGVLAEAKMRWLYLAPKQSRNFDDFVSSVLDSAETDIRHTLASNEADLGLSLAFISSHSMVDKDVDGAMQRFKRAVMNSDSSFYAWFNNRSGKDFISNSGEVCNATALIGRVA